jgi:hypothetical protein
LLDLELAVVEALASGVDYCWGMQLSEMDPEIEIGTITGTLRVFGEELVCRLGNRFLRAYFDGDSFVFSGGYCGDHGLDARASITSGARLIAHWRGYIDENASSGFQGVS